MNSEDRELFERLRSAGVCPFCERDPHEYVDIGVGMQPVAITCCDYGVALFQYGDKQLVDVNCRMNDAATRLESLCGEVERLKEALKPFAAEADMWIEMGDTRPICSLPAMDSGGPTVGDLRRAAALSREEDSGANTLP